MKTSRVWCLFGLVLVIAIGWGAEIWAQSEGVDDPKDQTVGQEVVVPEELANARATMTTFLEAFYNPAGVDLETAAICLDLGRLPPSLRARRGAEMAAQLKAVLDRVELIDLELIDSDPDGPAWTIEVADAGQIELSRSSDGRWLFSQRTLEDLNRLQTQVEDWEVVAGVGKTVTATSMSHRLRETMPSVLRGKVLSLEGWQWLGLIVLLFVGALIDRLTVAALFGPVTRWFNNRAPEFDRELVHAALRPMGVLAMVLVWWFGISWLGLPLAMLRWYAKLVEVVLVVTGAITAYRLVNVFTDVLENRAGRSDTRYDDLLVPLIRKSLKIVIVVICLVLLAETFERDFTGLLAGLGLGGLAFALAAKDTVSNLFGSLTVLFDQPFQVGDVVTIGDVTGTIEEVGFRSTRIRTAYNSLVTLPNSHLTSAAIDNLGARSRRRWSTRLELAYDTPPELIDAFCDGVRRLIEDHPLTRKEGFHCVLNEFGESGLEVMLYLFFNTQSWAVELTERHRLALDIIRLADELGVEFAFPTRTVFLKREGVE